MIDYARKTVAEILKRKRAFIKRVRLPKGSPSWDDILQMTWEEVLKNAQKRVRGFSTFKKLLNDQRFDK